MWYSGWLAVSFACCYILFNSIQSHKLMTTLNNIMVVITAWINTDFTFWMKWKTGSKTDKQTHTRSIQAKLNTDRIEWLGRNRAAAEHTKEKETKFSRTTLKYSIGCTEKLPFFSSFLSSFHTVNVQIVTLTIVHLTGWHYAISSMFLRNLWTLNNATPYRYSLPTKKNTTTNQTHTRRPHRRNHNEMRS